MDVPSSIERILDAAQAAFASGETEAAVGAVQRGFDDLNALSIRTETERLYLLSGAVRLVRWVLSVLPDNATLLAQRDAWVGLYQRRYGPGKPYQRSRELIEAQAARLAAGEDVEAVTAETIASLEGLAFDPEDQAEHVRAALAAQSLRAARHVLDAELPPPSEPGAAVHASLQMHDQAQRIGGFDPAALVAAARSLREAKLSLDGTPAGHARALMTLLGIGLRAEPSGLPALESIADLVAEALAETQGVEEAQARAAAEPGVAARCGELMRRLRQGLAESGFSEYLLYQALADMRELKPAGAQEAELLRSTLADIWTLAEAHAPPETAGMYAALRVDVAAAPADSSPLDAAALRVEGDALLRALRDKLAAGTPPAAAFASAMTAFQALAPRLREEEAGQAMIELMPRLVSEMVPYAETDKRELAADVQAATHRVFAQVGDALQADAPTAERLGRAMMRDLASTLSGPTPDPFESHDAELHHRQFVSLMRALVQRFAALRGGGLPTHDAAEAARLAERADVATTRLRAATSEAQWLEQLRASLRRTVCELRSFERRHHLMVVQPPWPADPSMVDANAVYYCGAPALGAQVLAAAARIGMGEVVAYEVDDPVHARWSRLRRCPIAVFDYCSYDRAASDPPGPLPRSRARLDEIARTAEPLAVVAYECGWAMVLGVPMLVLAREGQNLPFDIDLEPVRLCGDDGDTMRIVLGLQAALLGAQRAARSVPALDATAGALRRRFAGDSRLAGLIDEPAAAGDAVGLQLGAEALIDTPRGHGAMLAWPAFPPVYPATDGPRRVFHVTAFRVWSRTCEAALRAACKAAGCEYRIGYGSLDPDILGSVWDDIAGAHAVVADLTQLNPNAVLELGIAHALGRPTLVLTQTPDPARYLPALAKVRSHAYTTDGAGRAALARLLRRFVDDAVQGR